jgi:hypothetical protein
MRARYLAKLIIGLAIELPLLLWYLEMAPFGDWSSFVAACGLVLLGMAYTLIFEVKL